ncbi:auxiliary transport protein, MFP family, putative [Synechococcus sp. PCC 7335]|uniref:HlyD family secretion protein n=1 Tax=Synechococcus sp. (strain ATCC 29403 / PCC 7335) TaxID=91464 RepID=UPI00017ED662|nr:HlyD family efflux transporter periplasmic adaptor subunit [Synechococcus sp. PCC 7335]EDX82870.1 auxiliary transport protein, MFP family, putative [Synechococcus sp. PCC 7335]
MTQLLPPSNFVQDAGLVVPNSKPAHKPFSNRMKKLRVLIPVGLLLVVAGLGVRYRFNRPDDSTISLSGRIESYESDLGAKVGGRVESIAVREGDGVTQGQVIATLDDSETRARLEAAKARVSAAEQQITQAELQIEVVASQVIEAQLSLAQAQGDTVGRMGQSEASVAAAQAQLAAAEAQAQQAASTLRLARVDRDRFAMLVDQGAIAQQQFDQAQTQFETAQDTLSARQAAVTAAQQQVNAAQGALTQTQTSQLNPEIRAAQVNRLQKQQAQAQTQLAVAQAELKQAQADQAEIEARINDLEIKSPIDGVVLTRTVEPGEVISTGTSVLTVINLEEVYLRGYIPEGQVGAVRVGQAAQVFLDSAPDRPLAATVTAIDTEASFTPENIYFEDDRVTQVFGLKLTIDNPQGFAKPGMPADGEILLEAGVEAVELEQ